MLSGSRHAREHKPHRNSGFLCAFGNSGFLCAFATLLFPFLLGLVVVLPRFCPDSGGKVKFVCAGGALEAEVETAAACDVGCDGSTSCWFPVVPCTFSVVDLSSRNPTVSIKGGNPPNVPRELQQLGELSSAAQWNQ